MSEYDFKTLSDYDFEILARDLLQAEWDCRLESFKAGKDGGIDLRCLKSGNNVIVQCKHYANSAIAQLKQTLKKTELPKIRKLKPTKYFLATSLPLNPADKEGLLTTVKPFIKSPYDIYGKEDLNNIRGCPR